MSFDMRHFINLLTEDADIIRLDQFRGAPGAGAPGAGASSGAGGVSSIEMPPPTSGSPLGMTVGQLGAFLENNRGNAKVTAQAVAQQLTQYLNIDGKISKVSYLSRDHDEFAEKTYEPILRFVGSFQNGNRIIPHQIVFWGMSINLTVSDAGTEEAMCRTGTCGFTKTHALIGGNATVRFMIDAALPQDVNRIGRKRPLYSGEFDWDALPPEERHRRMMVAWQKEEEERKKEQAVYGRLPGVKLDNEPSGARPAVPTPVFLQQAVYGAVQKAKQNTIGHSASDFDSGETRMTGFNGDIAAYVEQNRQQILRAIWR